MFRHLTNRQLHFSGARLGQAVLAPLVEGFTLTAAVFSMSGLGQYLCIRSSLLFAQAREMSTCQYTALRTRLLAEGGYFLGVVGLWVFLYSLLYIPEYQQKNLLWSFICDLNVTDFL